MSEFIKNKAFEKASEKEGISTEKMKEAIEEKVENLSNLQQFLHHLKARDIGGMVGAITAIFSEYFGSKEKENKKEANNKKEKDQKEKTESQEAAPQAAIHKKLSKLKSDIKTPEGSEETLDSELINPDGSDKLFVGDSILHGFQFKYEKGKRPDLIGNDGYPSHKTLEHLREADGGPKLKNKKEALIYTGGNNVEYSSADKIVEDMIKMAEICKKNGIPKIVIFSRFPHDARHMQRLGEERANKRQERSVELRKTLLEAYAQGRFPGGTTLFDLYEEFKEPNGYLLKEAYKTEGKDVIHPRKAYIRAMNMVEQDQGALSKEGAKGRLESEVNRDSLA